MKDSYVAGVANRGGECTTFRGAGYAGYNIVRLPLLPPGPVSLLVTTRE
jgi:hypothetical protein